VTGPFPNPPGKHDDPIGDELTWEQLLTHTKGKAALWVVTQDRDYITKHHGSILFNAFLRSELLSSIDIYCFENIADGIADFAGATGEGKKDLPSPQKLEAIRTEIEESSGGEWGRSTGERMKQLLSRLELQKHTRDQAFSIRVSNQLAERAKRSFENSVRKSSDGGASDEDKE
jgi:hypothetical protein